MVKLYFIEEKGRMLITESQAAVMELCGKHFKGKEINYTGGGKLNNADYLLEEIKNDAKGNFETQAVAFIYDEGEKLFVCSGIAFEKFLEILKTTDETNVAKIIKEVIEQYPEDEE